MLANGAPGPIRTGDPQLRRLLLYPSELQGLNRTQHSAFSFPTTPLCPSLPLCLSLDLSLILLLIPPLYLL